jgi:cytoskeletal protein CcmA (bactofilin family)
MPILTRRTVAPAPPSREPVELPVSCLGKALTVRGVLDTDGELRVDGSVLGRINAGRFVLGVDGYVEGDVLAREAQIGGRFSGRIFALTVALGSSAEITGRVFHHTLTVANGARIDGRMPWRPLNFFESLKQIPEAQS